MGPGQPQRQDYEYERHGVCNLFMAIEPLSGRRKVRVTDRRTAQDFAEELRVLVDEDYPDADVVVLVTDNLNTHGPACLYERFEPAEARRIAAKIEWHYTPEHGSWLNIAECELSVLASQCLSRRIARQGLPDSGGRGLGEAAQRRSRQRRLAVHGSRRTHQAQATVSSSKRAIIYLTRH